MKNLVKLFSINSFIFLLFALTVASCSKEEIKVEDINSIEEDVTMRSSSVSPNKIYISSDWSAILNSSQFLEFEKSIRKDGITILDSDCNVLVRRNSTIDPLWESDMMAAIEYHSPGPGQIQIRFVDLKYYLYDCTPPVGIDPLCYYTGETLTITGKPHCIIGTFLLDAQVEDPDVSLLSHYSPWSCNTWPSCTGN